MNPLGFDAAAARDLGEAADRYDAAVPGLGGRFLDEFDAAADRVRENPYLYAVENDSGIRLAPLHNFPYAIAYLVQPTRIWAIAVADLRRPPTYWMRRLTR